MGSIYFRSSEASSGASINFQLSFMCCTGQAQLTLFWAGVLPSAPHELLPAADEQDAGSRSHATSHGASGGSGHGGLVRTEDAPQLEALLMGAQQQQQQQQSSSGAQASVEGAPAASHDQEEEEQQHEHEQGPAAGEEQQPQDEWVDAEEWAEWADWAGLAEDEAEDAAGGLEVCSCTLPHDMLLLARPGTRG